MEKIESIHAEYKIYNNGSTDVNQENGGAAIYIEDSLGTVVREEECVTEGKFCSSYTGECVAYLRATECIQQQEHIMDEAINTLSSASMSLVQALKSNKWTDTYLKQNAQVQTQQ